MSGIRVLTPSRTISCLDIYPNIDRIKKVTVPVYIIHGMDDEVVQFLHGQELQKTVPVSCQTPPWWVEKRGHNVSEKKTYFYNSHITGHNFTIHYHILGHITGQQRRVLSANEEIPGPCGAYSGGQ